MSAPPLPIDPFIPAIVDAVRTSRAAVITAAPGAGKTTRVPPALAADGAVILLQPRRIAARSIARRIAAEQEWTLGREVGWHVRFDRKYTGDTRLIVATEGILTARFQQDPLLSGFRTIILDEFHERSIHADLGIALAKQAWLARDDLRLVVMSATIDGERAAAYLGGCQVVRVPGDVFPLTVAYRPGVPLADAVGEALAATRGQVLCFMSGAPEIRRAAGEVGAAQPRVEVVQLHGSLDTGEQDSAIQPVPHRRVILATNIAETSLTVPGVSAVVDTGLHKVARYDPDRAIDSLETERIPADAADQRAGRAARLGPGLAIRLWHAADRLRPHREPDVHRVDLASAVLDVIAWGGDPRTLDWYDAPSAVRLEAALELLARLGALGNGRLTPLGTRMQRLPLHPRLSRILLEGAGAWPIALGCALLAERRALPSRSATTSSDLLSAVERERDLPPHVIHVARELQRLVFPRGAGAAASLDERAFRQAVFLGFPDRLGQRRQPDSPRVLLASGHGAVVGQESGVRGADLLVALDVTAGRRGEGSEATIRMASAVDREWLAPTSVTTEHEYDEAADRVRAFLRERYDAIVLASRVVEPDPEQAAALLREAFFARSRSAEDEQLERRLAFARLPETVEQLVARAVFGRTSLSGLKLADHLSWGTKQALSRLAPERLVAPTGRSCRLDYQADGSVSASIKLQELFGLSETPRIGERQEPVLLYLLAPNGRPVQTTRDLRSFWERTYPEVRKELRGRYPKHAWPDDPRR